MDNNGLNKITIEVVPSILSDHYDPINNEVIWLGT
ncbi:zinc metallopeptidase [Aquibacillus koreensis]|uniref:Zinc metallopeptidase n=1 Tax=Aquibacillus koreensis TaxID=279446 RepID=A0A9X4AIG1_9BACI|nr:zinc metallopeptidase [Aquibacillus koreensis]MDC3419350.1 zinc metallopeptidase [Aquibacillus koreensis]